MSDLATASAETPVGDLATELVTRRLESPTAATAVLSAASRLVQDMPAELAAEASVYAGLQRLACDIETTTFAADHIRQVGSG